MMIESLAPVIGAGVIVFGTVITQLYIHRNTIVEHEINYMLHKLDVVKTLSQILQKYKIQAERNKSKSHQMTPSDLEYLEDYFYKHGNLISKSIHEQYHDFIKRDTYYRIAGPRQHKIDLTIQNTKIKGWIGSESLMNDDLQEFHKMIEQELSNLESKCSDMIRKKSRIWWLHPSWRSKYARC